jgi:hypothetical protein
VTWARSDCDGWPVIGSITWWRPFHRRRSDDEVALQLHLPHDGGAGEAVVLDADRPVVSAGAPAHADITAEIDQDALGAGSVDLAGNDVGGQTFADRTGIDPDAAG